MDSKPYLRNIKIMWENVDDKNRYPFNIPSIRNIDNISFPSRVTYFVGENGSGKSTLLEAIAVALGLNAEGGNRNVSFSSQDTTSVLHEHIKTVKDYKRPSDWYFLRAESFYNVASYMDEVGYTSGYGGKSLHEQSHGESFMALLRNKLRGNGLYIFDEPEAALSPNKQLEALIEFHRLVQSGSQLIITTHSPILMAYPKATIYQLSDKGFEETSLEDTEHYDTTKNFLNRTDQMLKQLLD